MSQKLLLWSEIFPIPQISGRPFSQVKSKVKKDYASVQLTAWKVLSLLYLVCWICVIICWLVWLCFCSSHKSCLKCDIPECYSLQFWPIVSWINYEYMPLQLRVLFHSFVASCWWGLCCVTNWNFLLCVTNWNFLLDSNAWFLWFGFTGQYFWTWKQPDPLPLVRRRKEGMLYTLSIKIKLDRYI